jgi:hypothetical protein
MNEMKEMGKKYFFAVLRDAIILLSQKRQVAKSGLK